jgi:hypothetical protein
MPVNSVKSIMIMMRQSDEWPGAGSDMSGALAGLGRPRGRIGSAAAAVQ